MKQCPLCNRSYEDGFVYCLTDGALLLVQQDNEITRVSPRPAPPGPVPPQRQGSKAPWVILGILIVVFLCALIGGGAFAIGWFAAHEDTANSQPSYPSPQPIIASPLPTASPSPTPSPSPSPTVTEKPLSTGTYQCEVNRTFKRGDNETAGTVKLQISFNSDGSYLSQGYVTVHGTTISDQLGMEEKGTYTQTGTVLQLNERLEREFDLSTQSWKSWAVPKDGSDSRERIRNVTPSTFQLYDNDLKSWFTFAKL